MPNQNHNVPELAAQLLQSVVTPLPVVDVHTHIRPAEPAARDLGEIVFYHYILTELETAGVSRERLQGAAAVEEKIALFAAEYPRISNTITSWCLRQVLRALGMDDGAGLSVQALAGIDRKIRQTSSSAGWPRKVLVEQNNIRKTFLTLNITEELPAFDTQLFAGTLRLDDVLTDISSINLQKLEAVSGVSIASLDCFERALGERMSGFARSGGRALTAGMPTDEDFACGGRSVAEKLFAKVRRDEPLELAERVALHSYTLYFCVSLARDLRLPVQLLLGVKRPLPGNAAVPVIRPDLAVRLASLFHNFPGVSFDLLLSSVAHSQELIAVAKNYPNVSLSGHWWYAFSPPYIRSMLTERLLALPAVKLHGFFSDAYNAEWSAGKLALLRRELAWVLAELIISGYLSESQAPEIARALLYENPARFYKIPGTA